MNTPRRESKRIIRDTTLMGSAFNPEWVNRVSNVTSKNPEVEAVRGTTPQHTKLIERICASSEMPDMDWDERGIYWQKVKEAQRKTDDAIEKSLAKAWKTKEERLNELQGQLEEDLTY